MDLLNYCVSTTSEYINRMPKDLRKQYGQFFTSIETAQFMASLFILPDQESVCILDPGAGSGILSAALIMRIEMSSSINHIELTCYENDSNVLKILKSNLEWISHNVKKSFSYNIIDDNYICSQSEEYNAMLWASLSPKKYDMIIGNPPYMKIGRDASEALSMPDICYGAPNMYFLFAEMSMFNLNENCEMVYIIPRSWTSGAYFKSFRTRFLTDGHLNHIHLFVSRDKVFSQESVLQETIIIKMKKGVQQARTNDIVITTSNSNSDFSNITTFTAPYETVVHGPDNYVYLVTCKEDVAVLKAINRWKNTLPDFGIRMKTGLTVDFRCRQMLRNQPEESAIPLFYSQHIRNGKVVFPVGKENEYIVTTQAGLIQDNSNYLFVKRFTSKEEGRRLQCGIYLAKEHNGYNKISTQNKINFITGNDPLSESTVYGLYVLFNSTLYDMYYRILNGSTQVNSTEINSMPVPPIETIQRMGQALLLSEDLSEENCNFIMRCYSE